jgi:hypothetical protein
MVKKTYAWIGMVCLLIIVAAVLGSCDSRRPFDAEVWRATDANTSRTRSRRAEDLIRRINAERWTLGQTREQLGKPSDEHTTKFASGEGSVLLYQLAPWRVGTWSLFNNEYIEIQLTFESTDDSGEFGRGQLRRRDD